MKYFIGLDGGGTKTKCVLTDESLHLINQSTGGPSTFLLNGTEQVAKMLSELISKTCSESKIEISKISGVVLGSTGAGRRSDAERMEADFLRISNASKISIKNFRVESDARIALEGAFSGKPGSILIAGTGSIMFGKDRNGNVHRVGGFGRFIGDEGSGYMIGRKGLMAAAKHFDGRGPETKLTAMLTDKFGFETGAELITEVYSNKFDIASASPLVVEAAEKGDVICNEILFDEVCELILHIESMRKILNEKEFKLSLIGGTIASNNYYSRLFKKETANKFNDVKIVEPEMEPALGAALIARELTQ